MTLARRTFGSPAREQWERTERWYRRLHSPTDDVHATVDYALVFFEQIVSLRDWLVRSREAPQDAVEALFKEPDLRLCRDVANAAKHLDVSKPSVDSGAFIAHEWVSDERGAELRVVTSSGNRDLVGLAMACYDHLRKFLIGQGWDLDARPETWPSNR